MYSKPIFLQDITRMLIKLIHPLNKTERKIYTPNERFEAVSEEF